MLHAVIYVYHLKLQQAYSVQCNTTCMLIALFTIGMLRLVNTQSEEHAHPESILIISLRHPNTYVLTHA